MATRAVVLVAKVVQVQVAVAVVVVEGTDPPPLPRRALPPRVEVLVHLQLLRRGVLGPAGLERPRPGVPDRRTEL